MSHLESRLGCRRARVLLDAYLDGELRRPRQLQMDTHLAGCHACSQELLRARQVRTALRSLPPQACSDTVIDAVRSRIGTSPRAAQSDAPPRASLAALPAPSWGERVRAVLSRRRPSWQPAMALASLAVVALGGYLFFHRPQADHRITPEEIRRADLQVRWVLARIGQINDHTEKVVRDDVLKKQIADPMLRAIGGALEPATTQ